MYTIAINYGDNDFAITFMGVAKTLLKSYEWVQGEYTKEALHNIVKELVYPMYLAYQNPMDTDDEVKTYLQDFTLYLNEEVAEFMEKLGEEGVCNDEVVIINMIEQKFDML
ncbi:MAG: hypothetical protein GY941_22205 [Planctomycetes bacterium]|nr:hypothetical protein [Planctomycetota bacterium]